MPCFIVDFSQNGTVIDELNIFLYGKSDLDHSLLR